MDRLLRFTTTSKKGRVSHEPLPACRVRVRVRTRSSSGHRLCAATPLVDRGGCEPTVLIGVFGDTTAGDTGLTNARQFKIGYPTLDHWRWDESPGTFMVITGSSKCGSDKNSLFYATWTGTAWSVAKDSAGCPLTVSPSGHGPVLVHLGGSRHKLYYEDDANDNTGKPLRLIYADGTTSGNSSKVELADWEPAENAREVHFLWPDGTELNAEEESGLGDHMIFMPAGSNEEQYMYLDLGGSTTRSG